MIPYFVSYSFTDDGGFGFGNCQLNLQYPIRSHADMKVVTEILRQQVTGNPAVLFFTRFDSDTAGGQTR